MLRACQYLKHAHLHNFEALWGSRGGGEPNWRIRSPQIIWRQRTLDSAAQAVASEKNSAAGWPGARGEWMLI